MTDIHALAQQAATSAIVRVPPLSVHLAPMLPHPIWTGWVQEGGHKIPKNVITNAAASRSDPSTWATYDAARAYVERMSHAGLGRMHTPSLPLATIDLDRLASREKALTLEILNTANSYVEYSPSGNGLHVYGYCADPAVRAWIGNGRYKLAGFIDLFADNGFITITGNPVKNGDIPLADITPALRMILERFASPAATGDCTTVHDHRTPDEVIAAFAGNHRFSRFMDRPINVAWLSGQARIGDGVSFDHSAADMALLKLICKETRDPELIRAVFARSGLYDRHSDGTKRRTPELYERYLKASISRALSIVPGTRTVVRVDNQTP